MPKRSDEPYPILWARVRSDWWNVFMVLGEGIREFGRRKKIFADRKVLEWEILRRYDRDEKH